MTHCFRSHCARMYTVRGHVYNVQWNIRIYIAGDGNGNGCEALDEGTIRIRMHKM